MSITILTKLLFEVGCLFATTLRAAREGRPPHAGCQLAGKHGFLDTVALHSLLNASSQAGFRAMKTQAGRRYPSAAANRNSANLLDVLKHP